MNRYSCLVLVVLLSGCSEAGLIEAGGACFRSRQCVGGLVCVGGVCTDDLSGIEGGVVPSMDAGMNVDAGPGIDAGPDFDAGPPVDSGPPPADAGFDAGTDGGPPMRDAGFDAGPPMIDSGFDSGFDAGFDTGP